MIADVYEPLAAYRDEFREKFARLARDKFKSLVKESGIDVEAVRRQSRAVESLESSLASARGRRTAHGIMIALGFIAAIGGFALSAAELSLTSGQKAAALAAGLGGLAIGLAATALFMRAGDEVNRLERKLEVERKKAWGMMGPLNGLYTWDITVKLIEETVPRLEFDPYFTARRLADLVAHYGWNDSFNEDKSIVFAQSGVINSNPFVIGEYKTSGWKDETYYGTKSISWSEWETGADGKRRRVTRYETLTACVVKPKPCYEKKKIVIYGNDAAPHLNFSREPSGFGEGSLFESLKKKKRLAELKRFSQNLDDDSNFTLMANEEFETWFNAKDRDNEVEFRLLFTALAQTQMLALMKDRETGFGDDFGFVKNARVNVLSPGHLAPAAIDTAPERFRDWNYDRAEGNFVRFNEKYFRDIYFALAPVLAIPLYQQTPPRGDVGAAAPVGASFWEYESLANYYGDDRFKHPASITENILKTESVNSANGVSEVLVTAYGYRGVPHTTYENVKGGDGRWHKVAVEWTEYLPVDRTSSMYVATSPEALGKRSALVRRSLYSRLG